jgi:hypothetical protein
MEVVEEHLNKVYNAKRERFANAAKMIKQREEFSELDHPITMKEFAKAIAKLKMAKPQAPRACRQTHASASTATTTNKSSTMW